MAKQKTIKGPKTEKTKGKGKKPKDPIADADAASLREELYSIRKANDYARELGSKADAAKAQYNQAKFAYESAQKELNMLIDELSAPTLFRPAITEDDAKKSPDAWKGVEISDIYSTNPTRSILALIPTVVEKALNAAKLTTIGKIADWCIEFELTDIRGVGPGGAASLADALEHFWKHSGHARPKGDEPKRLIEAGTACAQCTATIDEAMIGAGGTCLDSEGRAFCQAAHRDQYALEHKKEKKTDKKKSERAAA